MVASSAHWGRSMAAVGAGGVFAFALKDVVELDKLSKQTQAIVELTDEQWAKARRQMGDIGTQFGKSPTEMMEGAKAWLEMGNSVASYIENVKAAAITSRVTGISIKEQLTETSAILRAMGFNPNDKNKFREFENAYLVGSKGMRGGAHAYGQAMKNFAPIAKSLGLTVTEASTLVQMLGGQFQGEEIGNAFKMGFARLMAPTPKAVSNLRGVGIDPLQIWGYSSAEIAQSGKAFAERLRSSQMVVGPELEKALVSIFETTDTSKGGKVLSDKLGEVLTNAYGQIGRSGKATLTGDTSRLFTAIIAQHLGSLKGKLNIEKFFELIGKQADNVPLIKELFGGHHIAKFQDLSRQLDHFNEQRRKNQEMADRQIGGDTLDLKGSIVLRGLSFEADRMSAAWSRLVTVLAGGEASDQGSFRGLAAVYGSVADALGAMPGAINAIDPNKLDGLGKNLVMIGTAVAGVGAMRLAIVGLAAALGPLAAPVAAGSVLAALIAWQAQQSQKNFNAANPGAPEQKIGKYDLLPGMRFWKWISSKIEFGKPDFSPENFLDLGPKTPSSKLEGQATVRIEVEGGGKVVATRSSGNIRLEVGRSMFELAPDVP